MSRVRDVGTLELLLAVYHPSKEMDGGTLWQVETGRMLGRRRKTAPVHRIVTSLFTRSDGLVCGQGGARFFLVASVST